MAEKKETPVAGEKQSRCGCGCIGASQQGSKMRQSEAGKPKQ
jgi:hypothetical protein